MANEAPARIGLVLSAGGMRGAAHLGVLRRLIRAQVPLDVIVGTSAGAILGAVYAAAGFSIDQIIEDAPRLRMSHLLAHSATFHAPSRFVPWLRQRSGIVPDRLAALEAARFDRLHHGVRAFGVVCHDRRSRQPWYFSTAQSHGAPLAGVVKASGAVPVLFPPRSQWVEGRELRLTDGGISDPLPLKFAQSGLGATHLILSDCLRGELPVPTSDRMVHLRPRLRGIGAIPAFSFSLQSAIAAGETAVTDEILAKIRGWLNSQYNESSKLSPPAFE